MSPIFEVGVVAFTEPEAAGRVAHCRFGANILRANRSRRRSVN
jgi:hypothetical protein